MTESYWVWKEVGLSGSLSRSSLSLTTKKKKKLTHVDLVVKVADVADDGVVLHLGHVLGHDDVLLFSNERAIPGS